MSFEIYQPIPGTHAPLAPGHCRFDQRGNLRFNADDGRQAQLGGPQATVLIDKGLCRIALRAPGEGEGTLSVRTKTKKGFPGGTWTICVRGPLKALGMDPGQIAGEYGVLIKDATLMINLGGKDRLRSAPALGSRKIKKR